jgi:hypothetical protein
MLSGSKGTEEELISQCSICGRTEALFDLPGTTEKFCWGCTEIDSATLAGVSTDDLRSELCDISRRMLDRSQSAELG